MCDMCDLRFRWIRLVVVKVTLAAVIGLTYASSTAMAAEQPAADRGSPAKIPKKLLSLAHDSRLLLGAQDSSKRDFVAIITFSKFAAADYGRICRVIVASHGDDQGYVVLYNDGTVFSLVRNGLAVFTDPSEPGSLFVAEDVAPYVSVKGDADDGVAFMFGAVRPKRQSISIDLRTLINRPADNVSWVSDPVLDRYYGQTRHGTVEVSLRPQANAVIPVNRIQFSSSQSGIIGEVEVATPDAYRSLVGWLKVTRQDVAGLPVLIKPIPSKRLDPLPKQGWQAGDESRSARQLADVVRRRAEAGR